MSNNTLDEISSNIDSRIEEFKQIQSIANNLSGNELNFFLKSCVPLLYAHWEGFVVSSLKLVFDYLNSLKLNSDDFCDDYLTTAYEQTLESLSNSTNFDKRKKHLKKLYQYFKQEVRMGEKIDTKSNLNFKILKEICQKINIDISRFNEYEKDLNQLVAIRNSIAHGENSFIFTDYESIKEHINLVENLMLDFQSELQELLKNEKYRRC